MYMVIMELPFDVIFYSKLCNENSDAGRVKYSRGPKVPHPCLRIDLVSAASAHVLFHIYACVPCERRVYVGGMSA